ncbi:hypothetical protein [Methylobacterium indicum]|uniref:hypothetical protein n=1 Tax=Methylobacterium indicum TaxID=1775910 RepID=UPI000A9A8E2F|nr:hypothetical protein [Methylobacterium indicum]
MTPTTTRTLNPLPFEHLEPKRFEDLARQLAYDFKPWRQLEATGRTGSDDGFDARGFEIVPSGDIPLQDDSDSSIEEVASDRLWLIQCKREKGIGPSKMKAHLEAIPQESRSGLYGLIFVASCDFSKATRDVVRSWCFTHNVSECHIWGKAEIEDMLYQPKNDNLLFAYFNISLQIRRQKLATDIRRTIAIKRKIKKIIDIDGHHEPVLLRDISDERYPFVSDGQTLKDSKSLWVAVNSLGLGVFGLRVILKEFWAYHNPETGEWDIASKINFSMPQEQENPWYEMQAEPNRYEEIRKIVDFWETLPPHCQYFFRNTCSISYRDIIEIDDVGDTVVRLPTIFMNFRNNNPPYLDRSSIVFRSSGRFVSESYFDPEKHVNVFPDELRDRAWEDDFFPKNSIVRSTVPHSVILTEPEWKQKIRDDFDKTENKT